LSKILEKVLSKQFRYTTVDSTLQKHFSGIRIMDSTEFQLPESMAEVFPGCGGDGGKSCCQIQLEFEVFSNKITQLEIGNALQSDRTEGLRHIDDIPKKTLVLRDLGYFTLDIYKQLIEKDLCIVSRLHSQIKIYVKKDGKDEELTHEAILELVSSIEYIDQDVYIGKEAKQPTRLVANKIDQKHVPRRMKRFNKRNRKKLTEDSPLSHVNLFITNLDREIFAAQKVYELYTIRWQIEIIFKTWKSTFKIHLHHKMNIYRTQCILIVKLIWVIFNWSMKGMIEQKTRAEISILKFSSTFKVHAQQLRGSIKSIEGIENWINRLDAITSKHCKKEHRKGQKKYNKIIDLSYC